jgi:hypothetical protein
MESVMTAQIHETLILNGEKTSMAFCPPLPRDHRVVELKENEIDSDSLVFLTACWRRYIGTWEIKDNKLYLNKLFGALKLQSLDPVHADWFTGVLRIPQGERLHYVHMGFGSVFEKELHIKIEKGIVIKSVTIDNRDKEFSNDEIGWKNLPGYENDFNGDDL